MATPAVYEYFIYVSKIHASVFHQVTIRTDLDGSRAATPATIAIAPSGSAPQRRPAPLGRTSVLDAPALRGVHERVVVLSPVVHRDRLARVVNRRDDDVRGSRGPRSRSLQLQIVKKSLRCGWRLPRVRIPSGHLRQLVPSREHATGRVRKNAIGREPPRVRRAIVNAAVQRDARALILQRSL